MAWMSLLRNALDRLALYGPALVMSVFALSSWWLVRSVPDLQSPTSTKVARTEPDYFLHGFSVRSFDAGGRLTRELQGTHARHYPEFDRLDMDAVQINAIDAQGQRIVARADHARSQRENDQTGTQTVLSGNANVVRIHPQDGVRTELRSDELIAYEKNDRVVSETPVEVHRGRDLFTGQTMDLNGESGEYRLQGRVRGTIMPTRK